MKQLFIAAFTVCLGFTCNAQVFESRHFKEITTIEVSDGIEVIFTQGNNNEVKVEADTEAHIKNIITQCKGNTLIIKIKGNEDSVVSSIPTIAKVYISQMSVNNFKASNAAAIKINGTLNIANTTINLSEGATLAAIITTDNCVINTKSAAGFRGKIISKKFTANVIGGSYIKLGGSSDIANVFCSGGSFSADKFVCGTTDIWAKNASSVTIYTDNSIKTIVDVSSSVTYYGSPKEINTGYNTYSIKRDKVAIN